MLSGISLNVQQGERVALLGRNGAGKTSLLRVLTGELIAGGGRASGGQRGCGWRCWPSITRYAGRLRVRDLVAAAHPYRELETELLTLEAHLGDPDILSRMDGPERPSGRSSGLRLAIAGGARFWACWT